MKSAPVASHSCMAVSLWGFFVAACMIMSVLPSKAQDSTQLKKAPKRQKPSRMVYRPSVRMAPLTIYFEHMPAHYHYNHKRVRLVTAGNIIGYSATLIGFYTAWYKQYPQTNFHSFNDSREWLQVDKIGHLYGAYIGSYGSMEMWRWTGIEDKKRIWISGLSGIAYQTIIETLDGFSKGWGWSWSDVGANIMGSGLLVGQELAWNEQRIRLKFSFHQRNYGDAELNQRADKLFGNSPTERFIKDYNAQTYWASVNLRSFFPESKLPRWLNVAVGYGAEGMFGAENNLAKDDNGNITFNRPDIKRYRQWFIAPDIDLTRIKTYKKGIRLMLGILNAFKFPAPSLEFSNGNFKVHGIHF
jgi:uncharacterized protein YfiM (DUF2279 family)